MCGKNFSIYGACILHKCIECIIFTYVPVPHLKLQVEFFENLFPPKTDGVGGSYDVLYQTLIRKYEDKLEHWFISIWYDCNYF